MIIQLCVPASFFWQPRQTLFSELLTCDCHGEGSEEMYPWGAEPDSAAGCSGLEVLYLCRLSHSRPHANMTKDGLQDLTGWLSLEHGGWLKAKHYNELQQGSFPNCNASNIPGELGTRFFTHSVASRVRRG